MNTRMRSKDAAIAAFVLLVWGVNFWVIKTALQGLQPMVLGTARFVLMLLPALFFLPRPQVPWRWLVLYGLSISFGQFSLMFAALAQGTPTGLAALLLQAQVFFSVLLAAALLHEPVRAAHLAGMTLAALGLAAIGMGQYQGVLPLTGVVLVLGSALAWAVGNMVVKRMGSVNALSLVVWGNLSALPAFALGALWLHGPEGIAQQLQQARWQHWGAVLYLAYVSGLLGYAGWGMLLTRYSAAQVTPLALLIPVIALLIAHFGLHEYMNAWHWAGACLVMVALVVHVLGSRIMARLRSYSPGG